MHGMQNIAEAEIGVFSMYFIGAFDAQIQRRWTVRGVGDADAVIIADFGSFGIASIGTVFALTDKGYHVICKINILKEYKTVPSAKTKAYLSIWKAEPCDQISLHRRQANSRKAI